jgi:hypothetical protein
MGWTSSPIALMGSKDKIGALHFSGSALLGAVNRFHPRDAVHLQQPRLHLRRLRRTDLASAARNILRKFVVPGDIW